MCVHTCMCLFMITWADRTPPNFHDFNDVIFNVGIHSQHSLHQLLLVYPLLHFLLLLLSVSLLSPEEDKLSKALVCYCFPVFHHVGEYVFLDLFHLVSSVCRCQVPHQMDCP